MTTIRLPVLRLNHALGAATILFAVLAVWPWLAPPVPANRPLPAPPASASAPALAALAPLASYSAIVERPLFTPSRRAPPGIEAVPGSSIETRYQLLGIVASGPRKKAFIAEGARRLEIAEGDMLDGWTVTQIGPDRVVLNSPAGDATLKLKPAAAETPRPQ